MKTEEIINNEIREAVGEAIRKRLTDYNSPLHGIISQVVKENEAEVKSLITDAIVGTITDKKFRLEAKAQIRHKIARELVNSFGEGIFKQTVDKLKQDHTLKARIVLAIEKMLEEAGT